MDGADFELHPIGWVESRLKNLDDAPRQGDEGAPDAWLVFDSAVGPGLTDLAAGDEVIVITWLHRAQRDVLRVHPRGDLTRPEQGVFSTRSPHRPNPIGLHRVEVGSGGGHNEQEVDPHRAAAGAPPTYGSRGPLPSHRFCL
jgi:tRNA-Thr(GGU) m(6)t(6)A37 methyltransferase TsaA